MQADFNSLKTGTIKSSMLARSNQMFVSCQHDIPRTKTLSARRWLRAMAAYLRFYLLKVRLDDFISQPFSSTELVKTIVGQMLTYFGSTSVEN